MTDPSYDPLAAFTFTVAIGSAAASPADGAFMEISGITALQDTEEAAGVPSSFVHRLPAVARHSNLVLKRGFILRDSRLADWTSQTIGSTVETAITAQDLTVRLLDAEGKAVTSWTFLQAWPVKWEVGMFDPASNDILTETLELAYATFQKN